MNSIPSSNPFFRSFPIIGSLSLAAMGQWFLIQQDKTWSVWIGLALFGISIFFFLTPLNIKADYPQSPSPLSRRVEFLCLALILMVALYFRFYRLDQFPPCLYTDSAKQGYGALRILNEGWNPFNEPDLYLGGNMVTLFYWLALWFRFFTPTPIHLYWGSIVISLLAFPMIYVAFRKLAGSRIALLSIFFLAVMRWNVTYSREAHPAVDLPLYLFGVLATWLWAVDSGKKGAFLVFIIFLAGGCYSYEAFVAFLPAILLFFLYELRLNNVKLKNNLTFYLTYLAIFILLTYPVWLLHFHRRTFGAVYDHFPKSFSYFYDQGLLKYLGSHFFSALLMFNREGDSWFFHNLPNHRMLDDVTGVFLILGLGFILSRFNKRAYFYGFTSFFCLLLPAILSPTPIHASRAYGVTPFVAFLAACGLEKTLEGLQNLNRNHKIPWPGIFVVLTLSVCAWQNYQVYFEKQAKDLEPWKKLGWKATLAAQKVHENGALTNNFLDSDLCGSYAVLFLDYDLLAQIHEMKLPENMVLEGIPEQKTCLFVEGGHLGKLSLFQYLYPGGTLEILRSPDNDILEYVYHLNSENLEKGRIGAIKFLNSDYGLRGTYITSTDPSSKPVLVQYDPLINFISRFDFPLRNFPPLRALWEGRLVINQKGSYRFLALASDSTILKIDGKVLLQKENEESQDFFLEVGNHQLELDFQKKDGFDSILNLLWRKPGDEKFVVIPFSVFRRPIAHQYSEIYR